jgi:acyl-coenzyme A synthetase/AMP-(fatty) acid ligase/acyl carrier protein
VTRADRATQIASPAFDGAVWEIWPYLTTGASIHIPDDATRLDPSSLRDWLVKHEITICFLPTPMAESAMVLPWPPDAALRILLTGADTLHRPPPPDLPFELVNNYGPTEATVVATSGVIPPRNGTGPRPSIGSPIDHTQAYVLDENLSPVPDGTPGELYIGGRGVARGYRNRPDLTTDRFVPDGFSDLPGARMYRTGDLVRTRPDGTLDFIGRIDQQVKIRGFRIELGEVEAVLVEHDKVHQAVVALREDPSGGRSLIAYVVSASGSQPRLDELRNFLRARLPEYMVPARIVLLDALPLTPNGKVDRGAVAAIRFADSTPDSGLDSPRTVIEERLAEIVCQLLKLEHVGLEDNFFLLGGHSLLGAQLVARVNDGFGVALPLRTLFDIPTVAGLSAEIERLVLAKLEATAEEEVESLQPR